MTFKVDPVACHTRRTKLDAEEADDDKPEKRYLSTVLFEGVG